MSVALPATLVLDPGSGWRTAAPPPGTWTSQVLDSGLYDCAWDRIDLTFCELPPGAQVRAWSFTSNSREEPDQNITIWSDPVVIAAEGERPSSPLAPITSDFAVQSPPGRFLWLRLELSGGSGQLLDSIRIAFPRQGLMQQLPAVYAVSQDPSRFLERFLALFDSMWGEIEQSVANLESLFDPKTTAAEPFLEWLAAKFGLPPLGPPKAASWRRLLETVPEVYLHRGSPQAVQAVLSACLANISGVERDKLGGLPVIVEGFRERRWLELDHDALIERALVYADERLVLGGGRVGSARIGGLEPVAAAETYLANSFRVFAPACLVDTPEKESWLRAAIDAERPAEAGYDLVLFENGFRLGESVALGVNSLLGSVDAGGSASSGSGALQ